jgi:hypothetical protein
LHRSSACAVVSRFKHENVFINQNQSGSFQSTADHRVTMQWPHCVSQNDIQLRFRIQPMDSSIFSTFCQKYSHECHGLLALGPIVDINVDDIPLLKPIRWTSPVLVQTKMSMSSTKVAMHDTTNTQPMSTISPPTQQELIVQQQQSIFRSLLGEGTHEHLCSCSYIVHIRLDSGHERFVLLYFMSSDNVWQADSNVHFIDSKLHDFVTIEMSYLHNRMIVVRCDQQLMNLKKLQTTMNLLEQTLRERSMSLILRRRLTSSNEICLVCCSMQRMDTIDQDLQTENYTDKDEQIKELIVNEGQMLEVRFRGNVLPKDQQQRTYRFAFNTNYPYYLETIVNEIDRYSQHLSSYFYGFVQIFSKKKILKSINKEIDKKKALAEPVSTPIDVHKDIS